MCFGRRALSLRAGTLTLPHMLSVAVVSTALGAAFAMAGAWPVSGFLALDLVLLGTAFRVCRRRSRCCEVVRLDDSGLRVRRVAADGRSDEWLFDPYWVRVGLDEPPRPQSPLTLSASGRAVRIGRFLTADAVVNDVTGGGTLTGQLIHLLTSAPGFVETCRVAFRRTSAAIPVFDSPCP